MSWGDRGWPLSSMNMWWMVPSHPSREQSGFYTMSQLECKLLESSLPLPPLLPLLLLKKVNQYLKRDIIARCFYAASVLLGISDPRMLILTSFVEQMFSSLSVTTSMVPMWFLHIFGCCWLWTFLPGWLEWLEHFIICSWGITELSEYFSMWVILMSAKAELRF